MASPSSFWKSASISPSSSESSSSDELSDTDSWQGLQWSQGVHMQVGGGGQCRVKGARLRHVSSAVLARASRAAIFSLFLAYFLYFASNVSLHDQASSTQ